MLRIRFHPSVAPPPDLNPFPGAVLREMLRTEGLADRGEVHCVLADDAEIADLNGRFRGQAGSTDVLASRWLIQMQAARPRSPSPNGAELFSGIALCGLLLGASIGRRP